MNELVLSAHFKHWICQIGSLPLGKGNQQKSLKPPPGWIYNQWRSPPRHRHLAQRTHVPYKLHFFLRQRCSEACGFGFVSKNTSVNSLHFILSCTVCILLFSSTYYIGEENTFYFVIHQNICRWDSSHVIIGLVYTGPVWELCPVYHVLWPTGMLRIHTA